MLQVYGEAWEGLNSPKITGSCTALTCRFVSIERIIRKLQPHVHSFVKLKKATFGNNAVHPLSTFTFGQRSPGFTKCFGAQNRIKPSLFSHPPETAYLCGLYQCRMLQRHQG